MLGVLNDRLALLVAVVLSGVSGGAALAHEGSDAAVALRGPNIEARVAQDFSSRVGAQPDAHGGVANRGDRGHHN